MPVRSCWNMVMLPWFLTQRHEGTWKLGKQDRWFHVIVCSCSSYFVNALDVRWNGSKKESYILIHKGLGELFVFVLCFSHYLVLNVPSELLEGKFSWVEIQQAVLNHRNSSLNKSQKIHVCIICSTCLFFF